MAAVALVTAFLLGVDQTMTAVVALTATYIVKGTNSAFNQIPDYQYPAFAQKYDNAVGAPTPSPIVIVAYPATFRPVTPPGYIFSPTYDQSVAQGVHNLETNTAPPGQPPTGRPLNSTSTGDVLWGYSQGATVVTQYKRDWNAFAANNPNSGAVHPTYVLVANPNRPNGGILERGVALGTIPILGLTFSGPTPTQTTGVDCGNNASSPTCKPTTYDIARQYDGVADAPVNPLNPIADLNAAMGFYYLHGQYPNADTQHMVNQGQYGDTQYYLIPTYPLPLLMPLDSIPVIGFPLADTLDPPLRVIVESAYDRSASPGQPTPFNPLYFPNPATFGTNLLVAIPTGLDNGISDFTGTRPLGTTRPGAFGVGGPQTPPLSTPSPGTSSTIPVLFGSPGGGIFALLVPTSLLGSLPGGLLPVLPSTTNPLNSLSVPDPAAGQPPAGAAPVVPAVASVNNTASTDNGSQPTDTTGTSSSPDAATPAASQAPVDLPATIPSGPRLNVVRNSAGAPSTQSGTGSTSGSQSNGNPVGSVVSGVTKSISGVTKSVSSALGGLSQAAKGGTQ